MKPTLQPIRRLISILPVFLGTVHFFLGLWFWLFRDDPGGAILCFLAGLYLAEDSVADFFKEGDSDAPADNAGEETNEGGTE